MCIFYIHFTVVELFIQQRETKDTHSPLVNQHLSNYIQLFVWRERDETVWVELFSFKGAVHSKMKMQ